MKLKEITITSRSGENLVIELGFFDKIIIDDQWFMIHRKDTLTDDGYTSHQTPVRAILKIEFTDFT